MNKTIRIYNKKIIINKDIADKIKEYNRLKQEVEPIINDLKEQAKDKMIEFDTQKVISNGVMLSFKNGYDKTSIDKDSLKRDYPNVYKEYAKVSHVDNTIVVSVAS